MRFDDDNKNKDSHFILYVNDDITGHRSDMT